MNASAGQPGRFIRFTSGRLLFWFVPLAIVGCLSLLLDPQSWRDAPPRAYGMFGGGVLIILFLLLVAPRRLYLHRTPEGLTIQYLTGRRHYSWGEVRNFRVADGPTVDYLRAGRRIVFDLEERSPRRTAPVRTVARLTGFDVSFPDVFEIGGEELISVLNAWQRIYLLAEPDAR